MKALLDTCIIIDALQLRKPFCESAIPVCLAVAAHRFTGCITAKAITDIYYITHHYYHDREKTLSVISQLIPFFDILDTTGRDCLEAITSPIPDYEDAVMVQTALHNEVDCIITRDAEHFRKSPVTVFCPDEFLIELDRQS